MQCIRGMRVQRSGLIRHDIKTILKNIIYQRERKKEKKKCRENISNSNVLPARDTDGFSPRLVTNDTGILRLKTLCQYNKSVYLRCPRAYLVSVAPPIWVTAWSDSL